MKHGWRRERRFWRGQPARDLDDELAFHLDMRADLLEHEGRDAEGAKREALRRFGDVGAVRTECLTIDTKQERRMRRAERWHDLRVDVRYALRRLRGAPGFTLAAIIMLALGVGAVATVFTVVDGVLLRPLPFAAPERLVKLTHLAHVSGLSNVGQSDASYLLYSRHAHGSIERIGAYRPRDVVLGASNGEPGGAERASAAGVSASLLATLGVVPLHGRLLQEVDDVPGAPGTVLLSHALWERRFGEDRNVVGKPLVVDGVARTIVGVLPPTFRFPDAGTLLWLPLRLDPAKANPGSFNFDVVARIRADVTADVVQRELAAVFPRLLDEFPSDIPRDVWTSARITPVVTPLREAIVGDSSHLLWTLAASVGLLFAIVIANVASLFLVRAESAYRDLAIRAALGAGARALAAGYLIEALIVAGVGATLGVMLAYGAITTLGHSTVASELPRIAEVAVDARVALFAMIVALTAAFTVNLLPIRRVRRIVPARALQAATRTTSAGRDRQRARSALVIGQVALALVLVAGSALAARSFVRLRDVHPGVDPRGVMTLRVSLPGAAYDMMADRARFFDRLVERARALPGVAAAGVTEWLPLTDDHNDSVVEVADQPVPKGAVPPDHPLGQVTPEYFAAVGIPFVAGRTFGRTDTERPLAEAIVTRAFAERYWGVRNALGKRVRQGLDGGWFTVIGVVGDVHMASLAEPAEQFVYFPLIQAGENASVPGAMALAVRSNGDPESLAAPLRALVHELDPSLAVYDDQPFAARVTAATARVRFIVLVLGTASIVALAIGMVGLYGVLSYGVTLRQREIGVRMALGATPLSVMRMIAGRGLMLAGVGVAVGLVGALAGTRLLRGLLHDVSPTDPLALSITCVALLVVALVACLLPARRAAGITPMEALRRD